MIEFEWEPSKAQTNLRKHGVSFSEAGSVLADPLAITTFDPDHSEEEDRFITIGMSRASRLLIVSHTDRADRIRIISTRELGRAERKAYEEEIQRRGGRRTPS